MRLPRRDKLPAEVRTWVPLAPGERILAWARLRDGSYAVATTRALHRSGDDGHGVATPYTDILSARWDPERSALELVEAVVRPDAAGRHVLVLDEPRFLPETVRERVQSSILLTRRVTVRGRSGATVVARRSGDAQDSVVLQVSYDAGVDVTDPVLDHRVETAVAELREQLGL